jgi:dipeptidyl aminopeptidase/acylaminoacyl peptidase
MPNRRQALFAAGTLPAWTLVRAQNPAPLPLELFFSHSAVSGAVLSPDGRRVALRVGAKDSRDRLAVLDLDTMQVQQAAGFTNVDVARFGWINDRRLVFTTRQGKEALGDLHLGSGLFAVDADGSGYRQLVEQQWSFVNDGSGGRQLPPNTFLLGQYGAQSDDEVLVGQYEGTSTGGGQFARVLRVHTRTLRTQELDVPRGSTEWLVDGQGRLRGAAGDRQDRVTLHWAGPDGRWRVLREFDVADGWPLMPAFVSPDGTVYALARPNRDTLAVYTYDPATDRLGDKPLLAQDRYDLSPDFIADDRKLLGLRIVTDAEVTVWLDDEMKALQAEIDKRLPDTANMIDVPRRGDSPFVLVRSFADVQPARFLVFDRKNGRLSLLGGARPAVRAAQMATMDAVSIKARDGLPIPGYLTLPRGQKKNLPLVVSVHGGPWFRGGHWMWKPEVQFLASRGYAVLEPDFRGSTGYGDRHFRASWKQWGLAMQTDLADAARWAIAEGIADPKRVAIIGASYGGYATLMGLIQDPDLFRCGVCWVGVSDLHLLFDARWSDASREWKRYGMTRMIGDREKDAERLKATSPLHQAARLKNPVMLAYGRLDQRVPIEHGTRMRDALRGHNPNVEWVEYEREGHGWNAPATEVDFWSRVERFLARHLAA